MAVTKWYGKEIAAEVTLAAIKAVDDVTEMAAREARADHWWHARRGQQGLEGQTLTARARPVAGGAVAGKFGTTRKRGFYGLFLEYREPFLRPVADRVFPMLPFRLRERVAEMRLP